jgi:hypothetical protein
MFHGIYWVKLFAEVEPEPEQNFRRGTNVLSKANLLAKVGDH